ncbi:MAG TPA: NADH-quinone oxidoreductase subunit NuoK [Mycobacteriales bacterium]|nr:NADH-quinone oxidoreductase subunit NuoK [Mycobacteriales bacterium]
MHLVYPTVLAALLFAIGVYGVLARRNAVLVLMSIEIMLNAVNINLIAFNAWLQDTLLAGQIFGLFVIAVAAAEVGVGLAIVLLIYRTNETVDIDSLTELGDAQGAQRDAQLAQRGVDRSAAGAGAEAQVR